MPRPSRGMTVEGVGGCIAFLTLTHTIPHTTDAFTFTG